MVVLDGLGSLPRTQGWGPEMLSDLKQRAVTMLLSLVAVSPPVILDQITLEADAIAIGPFKIKRGTHPPVPPNFAFQAPTTLENARRILRASQLSKSILLEGSPGVGKTSLVSALASLSCQTLCRVNLSDQTDLIDLFGSDLPLEGGTAGEFAWRDAEFLQALQCGHWVLLDEMNLAPQSVLEGLNAILDHRGTVFLPDLGRSFTKHPNFRLFAAQNPAQQGGGRKGLPKSFLNRFTKVYMEELNPDDLLIISKNLHPSQPEDELRQMIQFNSKIHYEAAVRKSIGRQGSPWEFNLRDIMRWLALRESAGPLELEPGNPTEYVEEVYYQRFRTTIDCLNLYNMEKDVFPHPHELSSNVHVSFTANHAQFGHSLIERRPAWKQPTYLAPFSHAHFRTFQAMAQCVDKGWLVILVGNASSGKTTALHQFAALNGQHIVTSSATSATDASDLLGGFEQEQSLTETESGMFGEQQESIPVNATGSYLDKTNAEVSNPLVLTFSADSKTSTDNGTVSTSSSQSKHMKGRFVWVDGPLVRALKDGTWFILDNANLCNPSVLDRLNSLCEPGGVLTLTERGLLNGNPQILCPHPNFRLFMSMDPANGELSRAMRNRGIEINITGGTRISTPFTTSARLDSRIIPQNFNHTHLRSIQHLVLLLSRFDDLPLDLRLDFLLQCTCQLDSQLFLRFGNSSPLESAVLDILGSHGDLFHTPELLADSLALPAQFLAAEVCFPPFHHEYY